MTKIFRKVHFHDTFALLAKERSQVFNLEKLKTLMTYSFLDVESHNVTVKNHGVFQAQDVLEGPQDRLFILSLDK